METNCANLRASSTPVPYGPAQVLLVSMVLAALQGRTPKDAWRKPASTYTPVDRPLRKRDADEVYRELAHAA
jgi:hypothetical protein